MTASHNASGAGVLAAIREAHFALVAPEPVAGIAAIANRLDAAIATIESAMAALQLAARRFSDQNGQVSAKAWDDNYPAVKAINDAIAALGPAPPATASNLPPINSDRLNALREQYAERMARAPATDASELSDWPEFRERRIALFKLWSGIPLDEVEKARDAYCYATPPAGGGDDLLLTELDELIATEAKLNFARIGYDEDAATAYGIALLDFLRKRGMELRRRLASGGGANNYGNASERDSQTDHRTAQCAQDTAEKMASRAGSGDSVRSGESPDIATQHALDIDAMVNHFLAWRLPDDFGPDAGISFTPNPQFPHAWPTGTNLLTAVQARAMFEHCAGGARVGQEKGHG